MVEENIRIDYEKLRMLIRKFTVTFLREAIVIVPRFHYLYQFVYTMFEWTVR